MGRLGGIFYFENLSDRGRNCRLNYAVFGLKIPILKKNIQSPKLKKFELNAELIRTHLGRTFFPIGSNAVPPTNRNGFQFSM